LPAAVVLVYVVVLADANEVGVHVQRQTETTAELNHDAVGLGVVG
jgi:hypothetical protein